MSGNSLPTPPQNFAIPAPVPISSTCGAGSCGCEAWNCSATAWVNGKTVDDPVA